MAVRQKPTVGQIVYSLNVGNAARRTEQVLTKKVVTSVGRKYFKIRRLEDTSALSETSYSIDGWHEKCDTCANSSLYESEQEWLDEREASNLCKVIGAAFEYGRNQKSIPLDKLRSIFAIIGD
jgi:CRISPR/Cas system-associated protein Cas10 (large subunit of type III CRISPR-Cas system)